MRKNSRSICAVIGIIFAIFSVFMPTLVYSDDVGSVGDYSYLQFSSMLPNYEVTIDLKSGEIKITRGRFGKEDVAACQSQQLEKFLQSNFANSHICLTHGGKNINACTAVFISGYASLYNVDSEGKIINKVNLGGDSFPSNGECHPKVDICDLSIKNQLLNFITTWKNNNLQPSPNVEDLKCNVPDLMSAVQNVHLSCSNYMNGKMVGSFQGGTKEQCKNSCNSSFIHIPKGQLECRWVGSDGTVEKFVNDHDI